MRKLLIGLAVLLSLAVIAVLVGPGLVDWTTYKAQIERQLTALFGRQVTIEGTVDFGVLPTPILTAEGVRVASPVADADPMLAIDALDVRVAFAPLFSGTVQVERVALDRPVLTIRQLEGGGTTWSALIDSGAAETGAVQLDRVTINDGMIRLLDPAGSPIVAASQVFGQVSAESLTGPFQALGSATIGDQALTIDLETGRLSRAGSFPVTLRLGIDGADVEARYAGLIGLDGRLQGEARASGSDLAGLIDRLTAAGMAPSTLAQRFSINGRVDGTPEAIQVNAVTAELGATRATGAISLVPGAVPQIDVALAANRVDLDAALGRDPAAPIDWPALWQDLAEPQTPFGIATGLNLTLDASADAVVLRDGLIRRVGLSLGLADGTARIDQLAADLPGSANLNLTGRITSSAGLARADVRGSVVSEDLRGLLGWLGLRPAGIDATRLRRAQVSARVSGTAADLTISGLSGEVDGTALSGALLWRAGDAAAGRRPGLGLRLRSGPLDLDAYLPGALGPEDPAALAGMLAALWADPPPIDATLDLSADRLSLAGLDLAAPMLEASLSASGLALSTLSVGDVAGAGIRLSGRIDGSDAEVPLVLEAEIAAEDAERFLAALGLPAPGPLRRIGPATLEGRVSGGPASLDLDGSLAALDGTLTLGGSVGDPFGEAAYDLALRLTLPEARPLVQAAAPAWQPRGPLGDLDLYTVLNGTPEALTFGDIQGRAAGTSIAGSIVLRPTAERPAIEAELRAGALDLTPLLPSAGMPSLPGGAGPRWSSTRWPLEWLGGFDGRLSLNAQALALGPRTLEEPAVRLALDDRVLTVERMNGGLFGGQVAADGRFDTAADPADLSGSIALTGAPLAATLAALFGTNAVEGTLDLRIDAEATGRSPAAMVATLEGDGLAAVRNGTITGLDLAEIGRRLEDLEDPLAFVGILERSVGSGRTPFDALNLPFEIEAGTVTTDALRLVAPAGDGSGTGSLDLGRGRLDLVVDLTLARLADAPAFGLRLTGDPGTPRLRLRTEALQAYLAQRAAEALIEP